MAQPVFQSLLVDHIWKLLLFQRIFWEGHYCYYSHYCCYKIINVIIFKCEPLILCLSCLRLSQLVQDSAYNQTFKLPFIVVFFRMVHNKKLFRSSSDKYRIFSEGPTWSDLHLLCSYKKWKAAENCRKLVAHAIKIVKLLIRIISKQL